MTGMPEVYGTGAPPKIGESVLGILMRRRSAAAEHERGRALQHLDAVDRKAVKVNRPGSRTPSRKMWLSAFRNRGYRARRPGCRLAPARKVMPGTLRNASITVEDACSRMICCGMTVVTLYCGVSSSSAIFGRCRQGDAASDSWSRSTVPSPATAGAGRGAAFLTVGAFCCAFSLRDGGVVGACPSGK